MKVYVGLDLACRGSHEAFALGQDGEVIASGLRFATEASEMTRVREKIMALRPGAEIWWISEPTGVKWMTVGHYFVGSGDRYFLVSNQKAHDLRRFWARHVKNDSVDAEALARIGFMAPQVLRPIKIDARSNALSRWVKRQFRTGRAFGKLKKAFWDLADLLVPGVRRVLDDPLSVVGKAFFERYANPFSVVRLGPKRFMATMSKAAGRYANEAVILALYEVCERAVKAHLKAGASLDFADLHEELRLALEELEQSAARQVRIREKLEELSKELDPDGNVRSIPGLGTVTAAACLAALGSRDFHSGKAFRAYTGLVPRVAESGQSLSKGRSLTKAGPAWLRSALYIAAETARRWDPQLAAVYHRAMVEKGHPHRKAVCAVATHLADRVYAVWRDQRKYIVRDLEGNAVTPRQARTLISHEINVPQEIRSRLRKTVPLKKKGSMAAASKGRGSPKGLPKQRMLPNRE